MTDAQPQPSPPTETPPPLPGVAPDPSAGPAPSAQVAGEADSPKKSRWPIALVVGLGCLLPLVGAIALTAIAFLFYSQVPHSASTSARPPVSVPPTPDVLTRWKPAGPQAAGMHSWSVTPSGSYFSGSPDDFRNALNKALFDSPWATTTAAGIGTFRTCGLTAVFRPGGATIIVEMSGDTGMATAVFEGSRDPAGNWTFSLVGGPAGVPLVLEAPPGGPQ